METNIEDTHMDQPTVAVRRKPCRKGTHWSNTEKRCIPKTELDKRKTRKKKIVLNDNKNEDPNPPEEMPK